MRTRTHAPDGAPNPPAGAPDAPSGADAADDPVQALWRRWVAEGDPADRDRLILHYAPLVKYVASRLSVGVSAAVELGDLISYGMFGLIAAIERYDPERGTRFASYAIGRIKGAIMDELRAIDWVPRAVRDHARAVQTALAELEGLVRRTPSDEELAAHMGITVPRLRELLDQISLTSLVALDGLFVDEDGGRAALAETLHDPHAIDPQRRMERRELRAELASAISKLSERDRTVVVLYYLEGMTLAQIGQILQVTESRVSQLHTRAVLALRAKLRVSAHPA
ncbi:MAG TPA: FliA/WhiG family RNA polymerase sigma factor [Euzebyales bacterium]|nr:FliA/WhiG family RNA polymerase sigma factor [Euzebyales bacterium]